MKHFLLPAILAIMFACNASPNNGLLSATLKETPKEKQPLQDTTMVADTTLEGNWQLQPVLASDTASGKIAEINFSLLQSKFTGNTGCNRMSGSFIRNGNVLKFDEQVMTTKMACPGYNEKAFMDNLFLTNNFKIENGVLMLMNNETALSKWVRKLSPAPLKKA